MTIPSFGPAPRAALALSLLALGLVGRPSTPFAAPSGTWTIEHRLSRDEVQLSLRQDEGGSHHSNSSGVRLRDLEGLDGADLEGAGRTTRFALRRDAGRFEFTGRAGRGGGRGTWSFAADPSFAGTMARRGYERPSETEQFWLALEDIGFAYVDELARQGYDRPSTSTLVQMGQHGVSLDYLRRMGALGYRVDDPEALIRMRDHGVDPAYVQGLEARGFRHLTADELVHARDHGVDPDFLEAFGPEIESLSIADVVRLRDHGVDGRFAAGFRALGYRRARLSELVVLRDHGVDPRYARELIAVVPELTLDDLRRARDHGVDAGYARRVKARLKGTVTIDDVIQLRDRGIDL